MKKEVEKKKKMVQLGDRKQIGITVSVGVPKVGLRDVGGIRGLERPTGTSPYKPAEGKRENHY